jgi:hypothetical protein
LEKIAELKISTNHPSRIPTNPKGILRWPPVWHYQGQWSNFEHGRNVTRAEAACSIIKALGNKR